MQLAGTKPRGGEWEGGYLNSTCKHEVYRRRQGTVKHGQLVWDEPTHQNVVEGNIEKLWEALSTSSVAPPLRRTTGACIGFGLLALQRLQLLRASVNFKLYIYIVWGLTLSSGGPDYCKRHARRVIIFIMHPSRWGSDSYER